MSRIATSMREERSLKALARLGDRLRVHHWWGFKLPPPLAIFYASCGLSNVPVLSKLPALAALTLALASGAAAISLVNDWFDRSEDEAAGKPNRLREASPKDFALLLLPHALLALGFVLLWHDRPLLLATYIGCWASFLLYSVPPFRLKTRGFAGILADAAGASLFPCLLALAAVGVPTAAAQAGAWIAGVALWSLMLGIRGILWHQLADLDHDLKSRTATFVVRASRKRAESLAIRIVFPLELAGLWLMLATLGSSWADWALGAYLVLVALKIVRFRARPAIVVDGARRFFLMHDYYLALLPLALLLQAATRQPGDLWVLAFQLVAFLPVYAILAREIARIVHH